MNLTDYHAKYFAHELTKRCSSDSMGKLAGAVAGGTGGFESAPGGGGAVRLQFTTFQRRAAATSAESGQKKRATLSDHPIAIARSCNTCRLFSLENQAPMFYDRRERKEREKRTASSTGARTAFSARRVRWAETRGQCCLHSEILCALCVLCD